MSEIGWEILFPVRNLRKLSDFINSAEAEPLFSSYRIRS